MEESIRIQRVYPIALSMANNDSRWAQKGSDLYSYDKIAPTTSSHSQNRHFIHICIVYSFYTIISYSLLFHIIYIIDYTVHLLK